MARTSAESRSLPAAFIDARIQKVRAALRQAKADALLVTTPADVSWLTGFEGDDSFAIVMESRLILISDSRYEEQIEREAPWITLVLRKKSILEETAKQMKSLRIRHLAVQAESITLKGQNEFYGFLKATKQKLRLKPVTDVLVKLRHIKDAHEIAIMEEAIRIAEGAFISTKAALKPGMTENEIAGLLGYEMRKRGALNSSFDSIVGANANGSLPHYRPGDVKLGPHSPLLIDWGRTVSGVLL